MAIRYSSVAPSAARKAAVAPAAVAAPSLAVLFTTSLTAETALSLKRMTARVASFISLVTPLVFLGRLQEAAGHIVPQVQDGIDRLTRHACHLLRRPVRRPPGSPGPALPDRSPAPPAGSPAPPRSSGRGLPADTPAPHKMRTGGAGGRGRSVFYRFTSRGGLLPAVLLLLRQEPQESQGLAAHGIQLPHGKEFIQGPHGILLLPSVCWSALS